MTIRLGTNPIGWTNDDVTWLGDDIPLDTCLAEAKAAGFSGVELGRKFPSEPGVLGPILERHGLMLASGWYSSRLLERSVTDEMAAMARHVALLKALGAQVVVFCESTGDVVPLVSAGLKQRPQIKDAATWNALMAKLTEMAERLRDQGLRMAYHHHMGTVVQSEDDVDRMMEMTGEAVGLLVDTGHMTFAGGDPLALIRRWGSRVAHVHAKDLRRVALEAALELDFSFTRAILNGVFTVPGDGFIDFAAMFTALKAAGYSGWVVNEAEQDARVAPPFIYARAGHRHLAQLAGAAGFAVA